MTRKIEGLKWAKVLEKRPACIPLGRARGAKAAGLRYERSLAEELEHIGAKHGQWFEFEDANGHGYAQADFVMRSGAGVAVLEAKYTWTMDGHVQLERLYRPLVERVWELEVLPILVCKKLVPEAKRYRISGTLSDALRDAKDGHAIWHWLGGVGVNL